MEWLRKISIADLATLGNGMCGFFAILYTFDRNFLAAYLFILLGASLDGLDGYLARKFASKHNAGRFLDSISDTISFCFAPSFLLYQQFYSLERGSALVNAENFLALLSSCLVSLLGLVRLLKFSFIGYKLPFFHGLPTPATAMLAVSLSLAFGPFGILWENYILVLVPMCFFSLLMVSEIEYPKPRKGIYLALSLSAGLCIFLSIVGVKFEIFWLSNWALIFALCMLLFYSLLSPIFLRRAKHG